MENKIIIEQLAKFSPTDTEMIASLGAKLGPNNKTFAGNDMQEMLESPNTNILVARETTNSKIVGMITVFVYRIPYAKKSYIDDFIVDENYRGQGIGTQLFNKAINLAKEKGAAYVDFTSSPEKIAGNKLYEKLGFSKRETNVYRLNLGHAEE